METSISNETAARLAHQGHGRAPVCSAGGRGFKFQPDQQPGSKRIGETDERVIGGDGGERQPVGLVFFILLSLGKSKGKGGRG